MRSRCNIDRTPEHIDTDAEIIADATMRSDPESPLEYSLKKLDDAPVSRPTSDDETGRLRREADEFPRKMSVIELSSQRNIG